MMGEPPEQFVVKATGTTGTYWLSELSDKGLRSLVPRERAAVFETITDAGARPRLEGLWIQQASIDRTRARLTTLFGSKTRDGTGHPPQNKPGQGNRTRES